MKSQVGMKPQDVLVLLKILSRKKNAWRQVDLAHELGMSQSEVAMALARARNAKLIDHSKKSLFKSALVELLVHALKYICPVEPGALVRGMPTAHSAPPLSKQIVSGEEDAYVWPDGGGDVRGQAIEPLYPSAPGAARKDPALYELLALVDAIRVGRVREQRIAIDEIKKRVREA
jgi:hypothetical protein